MANKQEPAQVSVPIYNADSIQHMDDLEHVRRLPDMYIGDTGQHGLHHLIHEIVNNSADEVLAGFATEISVTLHADNSISVRDNGRGIPVDINTKAGISGLELAMTKLKAGGKFGEGGYVVSGGLHGVGLSCVNFLSEWCEATVLRDGETYRLRCERGAPVGGLQVLPSPNPGAMPIALDGHADAGPPTKNRPTSPSLAGNPEERGGAGSSGTTIHWLADREIFGEYTYNVDEILSSLRHSCYLARNSTITFIDDREVAASPVVLHFDRGIEQFVNDLNAGKQTVGELIYVEKLGGGEESAPDVEVALQYTTATNDTVLSFANHIRTKEGGTHVAGFRSALSRVINQHAHKIGVLKDGEDGFIGDDVREGLTAVISVRLPRPQFESNTKVKLNNPSVEKGVAAVVAEGVSRFSEEHPQAAKQIVERVLAAQKARIAMQKASTLMRRQNGLDGGNLPGKLADCIERDPARCELFLVEGDSAGGSAKGGRDRRHQAILPLRGKILNVDKAAIGRTLENNEVRSLITAIGTGIDLAVAGQSPASGGVPRNEAGWVSGFNLAKLRYHRIIIMTDADVDGSHIRTLLLTFFFRYMRPLIEHGRVYMALPPLFAIKCGKDAKKYVGSQAELDQAIKELRTKNYHVARFKGLGEMNPEELYETTMNPETRRLARVTMADAEEAARIFSVLMSDRVEPRKQFIIQYAKEAGDVDWHC